MDNPFPKVGQGPAVIASAEDLQKEEIGFTHPNLHRRIDPQAPAEGSEELKPRDYKLGIYGVNSYRTTAIHCQDDESDTVEVP